jgi:hypothetical protein
MCKSLVVGGQGQQFRDHFIVFCVQDEAGGLKKIQAMVSDRVWPFVNWLKKMLATQKWGCREEDFPIVVTGTPQEVEAMIAHALLALCKLLKIDASAVRKPYLSHLPGSLSLILLEWPHAHRTLLNSKSHVSFRHILPPCVMLLDCQTGGYPPRARLVAGEECRKAHL